MDVGLPRRTHDMPDPINNLYSLWVREALEVAYDQVRCHTGQVVRRQKRVCCGGLDFTILPPS